MVALLNTRIDQEKLIPLLELCHPALLPVYGEALLSRNCRILSESSLTAIYIIVSQRPEELEYRIAEDKLSIPVEFIVQPGERLLSSIVKELSQLPDCGEIVYVPSQLVLTENMVEELVSRRGVTERAVTMGHLPYLLDTNNFTPGKYPNVFEGKVVDSIEALIEINGVESQSRKLYSDGVILHGVNLAAKPLQLSPGTSLKNTILLPGVNTERFEQLNNVIVTPQATYCLDTGEISERKNSSNISIVRLFDFLCAAAGLLVLAPLFLLIAILIKLDSNGPVFYQSHRAVSPERGRNGVKFNMKEVPFTVFRTMFVNADQMVNSSELNNKYGVGPYKKFDNDCRITRIGHFLRKTSLDELPLLWNVLKGDLSLVGTWALPKYEAQAIDDIPLVVNEIDFTEVGRARFDGTAGIAGLWQCGGRSDLSAEERAVLDAVQTAMESPLYRSSKMPNIRRTVRGYFGMIVTTIKSVLICKGAQ